MYRGYNLADIHFLDSTSGFAQIGSEITDTYRKAIKSKLSAFVSSTGKIDGSKLQEFWFPQLKTDVFISHSHKDKELAMVIAGWLKTLFNLDAFIDSCVWGFSEELLGVIDNEYCKIPGRESYYYKKRNGSTSHIHMMLASALGMMIDNTECLFFLNTPNSLTSMQAVSMSKTQSPWIYYEITIAHMMRKKTPQQHRSIKLIEDVQMRKLAHAELNVEYQLGITSLTNIDTETLLKWEEEYSRIPTPALDILYRITSSS